MNGLGVIYGYSVWRAMLRNTRWMSIQRALQCCSQGLDLEGVSGMASMEERMAGVECALSRLATKADAKGLEARLTRMMYALAFCHKLKFNATLRIIMPPPIIY